MASSNFGTAISPATLKDGSLRASLDPVTSPQSTGHGAVNTIGVAKAGALASPVLSLPVAALTGGTLAAGAYAYRVSAVGVGGEGVPCPAQTATTTGATSTVTLTWTAPTAETGGFKVYRNGLHLADVAHAVLTLVDSGAVTPSGAIPNVFPGVRGSVENSLAPQPKDGGAQTAFPENPVTFAGQTKGGAI